MELSISKKDFLRGLARTHAVADRKSSMPILSNVLLSADDSGLLRFAATDLYLAVSASAEANIKRGGTVALSARTLFDIVKNLPEGEVKLGEDLVLAVWSNEEGVQPSAVWHCVQSVLKLAWVWFGSTVPV